MDKRINDVNFFDLKKASAVYTKDSKILADNNIKICDGYCSNFLWNGHLFYVVDTDDYEFDYVISNENLKSHNIKFLSDNFLECFFNTKNYELIKKSTLLSKIIMVSRSSFDINCTIKENINPEELIDIISKELAIICDKDIDNMSDVNNLIKTKKIKLKS